MLYLWEGTQKRQIFAVKQKKLGYLVIRRGLFLF
jgi:hypothetical protein